MASVLRRAVLSFAAVVVGGGAFLFAPGANAHPMAPSLLEIVESSPGTASVRWKTPIAKVPGDRMVPRMPPHCHSVARSTERTVGTAVVQTWELACDGPLEDATIAVENIATSKANVILRVALADGGVFNTVLSEDRPSFVVPSREKPGEVVRSYFGLGVEHILTGLDHLLFVLGLMLLVAGRRQLFLTVTAFTAGHSVTLSLAALGFVAVPSLPVEVLIALSILLVAVELASRESESPSLLRRWPWAVAFVFGLLHGFGFAGALSEIGLPQREIPLALLSFNLGIEAGQLVFCGVALTMFALLRFLHFERGASGRQIAAYFIGGLAAFWMIERAAASL